MGSLLHYQLLKLQQIGKPVDLYTRPKNRFVAEFFGEINVLPGKK